uniref:Uncharacterized protein n=1 Tax=Ciona intestinalis TaxID=7719 RepID=F6ULK2_CIOIN
QNNDPSTLENPLTSPIEGSELSKSYTDNDDDFESCSDSDEDKVKEKPCTPACWGVLSRSNVLDYDEWRQLCDLANMLLRREPEPEDYEVDHSLPDCELRCQFISPFYPLVETRLEFVGGAFSNTCSPCTESYHPSTISPLRFPST